MENLDEKKRDIERGLLAGDVSFVIPYIQLYRRIHNIPVVDIKELRYANSEVRIYDSPVKELIYFEFVCQRPNANLKRNKLRHHRTYFVDGELIDETYYQFSTRNSKPKPKKKKAIARCCNPFQEYSYKEILGFYFDKFENRVNKEGGRRQQHSVAKKILENNPDIKSLDKAGFDRYKEHIDRMGFKKQVTTINIHRGAFNNNYKIKNAMGPYSVTQPTALIKRYIKRKSGVRNLGVYFKKRKSQITGHVYEQQEVTRSGRDWRYYTTTISYHPEELFTFNWDTKEPSSIRWNSLKTKEAQVIVDHLVDSVANNIRPMLAVRDLSLLQSYVFNKAGSSCNLEGLSEKFIKGLRVLEELYSLSSDSK